MKCQVNDAECVPGRLRAGHCERHYRRLRSKGTTASPLLPLLQRYEVVDGCHRYTGPLYPNGYGKLSRELHGTRLAHRAAWIERYGPIDDDTDVHHACHQAGCESGIVCEHRRCMNVEHLRATSRSENLIEGDGGFSLDGLCKNRLHDITQPGSWRWSTTRIGDPPIRICVACVRAKYARAHARRRG